MVSEQNIWMLSPVAYHAVLIGHGACFVRCNISANNESDQTKIFGGDGVDDPHTQVYFVAPRPRVPIFDRDGEPTPDNKRQAEDANAGQLAFGSRLDDIRDSLSFLETSDFTTVEYSPKVLSFQKLISKYAQSRAVMTA